MEDKEKVYKRRVRYKGTHPRAFKEKYKEHQPEKYEDTIQRIIEKGDTPAGTHRPICVDEILNFLDIKPNQKGLDATLGYGGHTLEVLKKIDGKGFLHALDADPIEIVKTKERLETLGYGPEKLSVHNINFSDIDYISLEHGTFDFIIADLGISSMQIDNPARGFSFKTNGPLDLRMNPNAGISAAQLLEKMHENEIIGTLIENADEPYAKEIAREITLTYQKGLKIQTTTDLYNVVKEALGDLPNKIKMLEVRKSSQRTFQALRIAVNDELQALFDFLEKIPKVLKPGGKVAILSFHSGEDRLVKKSFQHYFRQGIYSNTSNGIIRPSMAEQTSNSRSRPAKLRWAIKA